MMQSDFLIIGSGLAGLTSALTLADFGTVTLISKVGPKSGSSPLAQGGIAVVTDKEDSFRSHIEDTMVAGAKYNKTSAVRFLVEHGPSAIKWLESQGIEFDKIAGGYALGREAAHSSRRVLHITDFTGLAIVEKLLAKIRNDQRITFLENCFLVDILTKDDQAIGASLILNDRVINYFSRCTVLATGGLGQIYSWTTNPLASTGDGIAAAYRAGARLKDLEFIQFHPTALAYGNSPLFLLSEALRGEEAYLINEKKERFMKKYDPRMELAPRDIVARAIYQEQKNSKVYLDICHKGKVFLQKRFPNIFASLLKRGFDLSTDLIPVTPAAHYSCGGIIIDNYGRTNIANLFAFGEVSCSGVHGANRLASNSLLEAVVFPMQISKVINKLPAKSGIDWYPKISQFKTPELVPDIKYPDIKKELQKLMWNNVGIIRSHKNMLNALNQINVWEKNFQIEDNINTEYLTLKNMITVSKLVTESALRRKKSLGAHYINDI